MMRNRKKPFSSALSCPARIHTKSDRTMKGTTANLGVHDFLPDRLIYLV